MNTQAEGYSEELKGWVALFKDEQEYLEYLKWRKYSQQLDEENYVANDQSMSNTEIKEESSEYLCSSCKRPMDEDEGTEINR